MDISVLLENLPKTWEPSFLSSWGTQNKDNLILRRLTPYQRVRLVTHDTLVPVEPKSESNEDGVWSVQGSGWDPAGSTADTEMVFRVSLRENLMLFTHGFWLTESKVVASESKITIALLHNRSPRGALGATDGRAFQGNSVQNMEISASRIREHQWSLLL